MFPFISNMYIIEGVKHCYHRRFFGSHSILNQTVRACAIAAWRNFSMPSLKPHSIFRLAAVILFVLALGISVTAQLDPDPNSPQPVLLTKEKNARALVSTENRSQDIRGAADGESTAFEHGTKVVLYASNFDFLPGEGANSIRVYGLDRNGRHFRFPVLAVEQVKSENEVYAVTVLLEDEIRYWQAPERGDLLVYLTWRGLASNKAWFGYGEIESWKTDLEVVSAPLGSTRTNKIKQNSNNGPTSEYVGYRWSGDRMRFLEQATFGPTSTLDFEVRRNGIRQYLVQQFSEPYPSSSNPYPNQPLKPGNAPADCDNEQTTVPDVPVTCFRDTYTQYQPQTWFMREAFYGDAQLRHRVAWALSQIWVTSGVDIQQGRHMVEWHKVLSNNAFGNYRDLMKQMTLNPTMGEYLDMARSTRNNPNENYARELKQLFTIGLFMMNQDGTYQLDASNNRIPTYDQNVVNNFTKVLTGWGFCQISTAGACPNLVAGTVNFIDPMPLNVNVTTLGNNRHDLTAKTLLSYPGSTTTNVAACTGTCDDTLASISTYANNSMDQALDNIFYHPNLGPYISRILIQQLVTSDPTPAYVGRVAAVFANNGTGVRGDLKAVIRAILLDPEARGDVKTDPFYGKLREPVLFTTNFARTFGVRGANGAGTLSDGHITGRGEFTGMGQVHFRSPTVFNYYPPDYVVPGTAMLGPEFAIMTTGTSITRTNFIYRMLSNFTGTIPIPPGSIPVPISNDAPNGTSFDFTGLQALVAADPTNNRLLDDLNNKMLHGTMTAQNRATIQTALNAITLSATPTEAQTIARVRQAIYLIATSSQYQVQR